jgi:hypothetical protein
MELNQENSAFLILWLRPMQSRALRWEESLWPPIGVLKGIISFSHPSEKGKDETEKGGTPRFRESDRLKGTKYGERTFKRPVAGKEHLKFFGQKLRLG